MMVILNVTDDGYYECTWWWLLWVYLMMVILSVPDDGYSECMRVHVLITLFVFVCEYSGA